MRGRGLWVAPLVAVVALLVNLPLLNALFTSVKSNADIGQAPLRLPSRPVAGHYLNAIYAAGYDFPKFFLNSVLLSLGAVLLVLVIGLPACYAIVRLDFGGRTLLRAVTSLRLLPAIFFAIPFYLLFTYIGLLDTVLGLVLANTFLNLPLGMLLFAPAFRDIPLEIEEAALIDGCGTIRLLGRICVPLIMPSIVSAALLTFMFSWADYLFAIILSTTNATPVTVGAANFVTSYGIRWGDISAATVLSVLPPMVFATLLQRYLVRGLSLGAVKG